MIFNKTAESIYRYILEVEMLFLMHYKLNPFEMSKNMTVLDMHTLMKMLEYKIKKENKSYNKKDLWKALINIRDILNYITMNK